MKNVEVKVKDKTLVAKVPDLTKDHGESSSGKTHIVATSSGPRPVPGWEGYFWALNVFAKPDKAGKPPEA